MKKEDLVIGMNYSLYELEVQLIGYDPEYDNNEVVLLKPLNKQTVGFYKTKPDGYVRLNKNTLINCFNISPLDLSEGEL